MEQTVGKAKDTTYIYTCIKRDGPSNVTYRPSLKNAQARQTRDTPSAPQIGYSLAHLFLLWRIVYFVHSPGPQVQLQFFKDV